MKIESLVMPLEDVEIFIYVYILTLLYLLEIYLNN